MSISISLGWISVSVSAASKEVDILRLWICIALDVLATNPPLYHPESNVWNP